jgi:hypothetical protein
VQLPSDALVCAVSGLDLRSSPAASAPTVATLPDEALITVDAFRLTSPGRWSADQGGVRGAGWYHVSSPIDGWAPAATVVAADASCQMALPPPP